MLYALFFYILDVLFDYLPILFENLKPYMNPPQLLCSIMIIMQGYGMTEAQVLSMSLCFAKKPFSVKPKSCGTVVRNARMKIIDLETGLSLPYNQKGEICIRGPQIMKGEPFFFLLLTPCLAQ